MEKIAQFHPDHNTLSPLSQPYSVIVCLVMTLAFHILTLAFDKK